MNCQRCLHSLPDLLLDPTASSNAAARAHLDSCAACSHELHGLQATFDLLGEWHAPEPSPYFDQKLAIRLREEQSAPPATWLELLRSRFLFNTGRQFRPALVAALAFVLVVGGGTIADLSGFPPRATHVQTSATVNDLQILDKNEQALQTMDQLLQNDNPSDNDSDI